MRIQCPACLTIYQVAPESIGAGGRMVRCAKCREHWHATPMEEPEIATPKAIASPKKAKPAKAKPKSQPEPSITAPVAPPAAETADFDETFNDAPEPEEIANDALESDATDISDSDERPQETTVSADDTVDEEEEEQVPVSGTEGTEAAGTDETGPSREMDLSRLKEARERVGIVPPGSLAAPVRRAKTPQKSKIAKYLPSAAAAAAAIFLMVGPVLFRESVVAAVPDTAGLFKAIGMDVNLRGLDFDQIETFRESDAGTDILVVEGLLINVDSKRRTVPAVRLALLGEDANELYAWAVEPRTLSLEAGESTRFRARLASPPPAATDVTVRFVDRAGSTTPDL